MVPAVVLVDDRCLPGCSIPVSRCWGTHKNSVCTSKQLGQLCFTLPPHPTVPGRPVGRGGGWGGVRARRCDAPLRISPTPGERGAGLPGFVGVGSCLPSISRSVSALPGEISAITESLQVNLIRVDGPAARKGAGVKFTPASLRLRICGLCGHGRAAQGEPNRLSRLNHHSQKP